MIEQFLKLLERFVVAHELIAANSGKPGVVIHNHDGEEVKTSGGAPAKELPVEGAAVVDTKPAPAKPKKASRPAPAPQPEEDDLADEPAPAKVNKPTPAAGNIKEMRDQLRQIATAISAGESDECCDKFDDMLDEYGVRTVPKLTDEQVPAFYAAADELLRSYYNVTE